MSDYITNDYLENKVRLANLQRWCDEFDAYMNGLIEKVYADPEAVRLLYDPETHVNAVPFFLHLAKSFPLMDCYRLVFRLRRAVKV